METLPLRTGRANCAVCIALCAGGEGLEALLCNPVARG
jgi:hypothetical protein